MTVDRNLLFTNFAKAIVSKDKEKDTVDVVNATVHMSGDDIFIEIDGSNGLRTPANTLIEVTDKQRVQAEIKNHVVTIVGSSENVAVGNSSYQRLKSVVADEAYIDELFANDLTIGGVVKAANATVEKLDADYAEFKNVVIDQGQFDELVGKDLTLTGMLFGKDADFKKIVTNNAFVKGTLSTSGLVAADGTIINLENTYANIKFANIGEEAVNNLYAKKGVIGAASIDADGIHIAGDVVGINIHGDVIEGNTIKAESLIIKGSDGLYHQLNVDGGIKIEELTEEQQDEYNSKLHGSNIIANTITADQIYVDDLSALDATIGGFKIGEKSIYSGVKTEPINTTRGVYMDDEGQFSLGDSSNFLRYYKDENDEYQLEISAKSFKFTDSDLDFSQIEQAIDDASKVATNYLQFDSDGLVIGDLTDPDNLSNVLIDSNGVHIRDNEIDVASFTKEQIQISANNNYHMKITNSGLSICPPKNSKWKKFDLSKNYINTNDGLLVSGNYKLGELTSLPVSQRVEMNQIRLGSDLLSCLDLVVKSDSSIRGIRIKATDGFSDGSINIYPNGLQEPHDNYEYAILTTDAEGNLFINDYPIARYKDANNHPGFLLVDDNDHDFIRTTQEGILPYQSDGSEGYSQIGTASWPFKDVYTRRVHLQNPIYKKQAVTVVSNETINKQTGVHYTYTAPTISGYTAVGLVRVQTNHTWLCICSQTLTYVDIYNPSTSNTNITVIVDVLYLRDRDI